MSLVQWAFAVAEEHLASSLSQRWKHVQGVAEQARSLRDLAREDADLLEASAILHDVGYAPGLVRTGFHPIDGAHFLQAAGAPARLVDLVAHHSFAALEAELRGLSPQLEQFADERGPIRDALWYCDQTTGPSGERVSVEGRHTEILRRYGPAHMVSRFIEQGGEELKAAVRRTEERMAAARGA